eukprot:6431605-Alexandrium_andersonii.AAC.1
MPVRRRRAFSADLAKGQPGLDRAANRRRGPEALRRDVRRASAVGRRSLLLHRPVRVQPRSQLHGRAPQAQASARVGPHGRRGVAHQD